MMGREATYNGWTNYETWNVKLWLDNDEGTSYMVEEWAAENREDAYRLAELIKDYCEECAPDLPASMYSDLLRGALDSVDWREIAEAYIEDLPEIDEE
jgi:hypothetical protein